MAKRPATPANPFDPEQFFEAMKAGTFDFTKAFESFKVPGLDGNVLVEAQRKNFEAVVAAQRICPPGRCAALKQPPRTICAGLRRAQSRRYQAT